MIFQCFFIFSIKISQIAQNLTDKDIPSLRISFPSLTYFVKDGLHIPEYGKTITRGQGISIIENMNEWTWDSK